LPERMPCDFFLIRYVPDPVKGEFANIGVLLREVEGERKAAVRFTRDWSRVSCMDADADIGLLESLEAEIDARLSNGAGQSGPVIAVIEDTFSNSIQMTEARACLAENLVTEMELLMRLYVEPLRIKQSRTRTGRAAIAATMRTQFERAGVWRLMRKKIATSMYTLPGDPMKIDCGYRPNGVLKFFHAVSLESDVEGAKGLAYSAPRLRDGVARLEDAKLDLAAVVEPLRSVSGQDEILERYRFGVEAMEREGIRVLTTNDLGRAAETARIELRI
jgi:Protein of unknown function (DUF3037)